MLARYQRWIPRVDGERVPATGRVKAAGDGISCRSASRNGLAPGAKGSARRHIADLGASHQPVRCFWLDWEGNPGSISVQMAPGDTTGSRPRSATLPDCSPPFLFLSRNSHRHSPLLRCKEPCNRVKVAFLRIGGVVLHSRISFAITALIVPKSRTTEKRGNIIVSRVLRIDPGGGSERPQRIFC